METEDAAKKFHTGLTQLINGTNKYLCEFITYWYEVLNMDGNEILN